MSACLQCENPEGGQHLELLPGVGPLGLLQAGAASSAMPGILSLPVLQQSCRHMGELRYTAFQANSFRKQFRISCKYMQL